SPRRSDERPSLAFASYRNDVHSAALISGLCDVAGVWRSHISVLRTHHTRSPCGSRRTIGCSIRHRIRVATSRSTVEGHGGRSEDRLRPPRTMHFDPLV